MTRILLPDRRWLRQTSQIIGAGRQHVGCAEGAIQFIVAFAPQQNISSSAQGTKTTTYGKAAPKRGQSHCAGFE
jgi:hypothetical protein